MRQRGRTKGVRSDLCSKCNKLKESKKRYCKACFNLYMKQWRKIHPLNEFQRAKAITRSKTKVYVTRGKIKKLPCNMCGTNDKVQAHHHDYNDFMNVEWLCVTCHREHHVEQTYNQWKWKQLKMF
jgi:hypothetical protein